MEYRELIRIYYYVNLRRNQSIRNRSMKKFFEKARMLQAKN
jgi:hypothetical protein